MAQDARKDFDPERVRAAWRRRRGLAALAFVVPFTAAVTLAVSLPSVYQSSATVLVERQQVAEIFVKSTVLGPLETRLQTINQEILSRPNLEPLIAKFHLYPNVSMSAAVERMRRDIQLDLRSVRGGAGNVTIAFAVTYRGTARDTVAPVANAIATFYIDENVKVRQRQATAPAAILKVPLESAREQLDAHERRLREFQRRYAGEMPQDLSTNIATLGRLESQLHLNRGDQHRAIERREFLRDTLADAESLAARTPSAGTADGSALADRVEAKRAELAALRSRYNDRHPEVDAHRRELADLEAALPGQVDRPGEKRTSPSLEAASLQIARLRQALREIESLVASLQAEEQRLRGDIEVYRGRTLHLGTRDEELKELARNFDAARDVYRNLTNRYEEAKLGATMEQRQSGEQFRLLDAALPPAGPSAPRRALILLIGLVASLGVAAVAVMLAEYLDVSFHTVDELQASTSARVIAAIPWIDRRQDARRNRWRVGVAAAMALVLVGTVAVATRVVVSRADVLLTLLSRPRS